MTFSRADILANSRVFALREAVVAAFRTRFPDVEAKAHVGRLDMGDVLEKDLFAPPSIAVAVTRIDDGERLSGADDLVAHLTAYVVTEDDMIAGRLVKRDEMAIALCEAVLVALGDPTFTHFDANVGDVEDARASPLFTMASFEKGTVYYAVTWKQALYAVAPAEFFTGDET